MATVKYTGRIESDMCNKIDKAYRERINAVYEKMEACITAEGILDSYIKGTGGYELYEKSKHWLETRTTVRVPRWGTMYLGLSRSFTAKEVRLPDGIEEAAVNMMPYFDELMAPYLALRLEKDTLEKECNETKRGLVDTFNSYPSVNAAVKANPELEYMLGEDTKNRMAEKIERVKREAPVVHVNLANIKSIALINRMSGA